MEPGGSGTAGNSSGGAGRRPFNFPGNNSSRNQQQNVGDSSAPSKSNPNLNKDGNESPESGSLYSDEIPSGYNSGEQYDTVSCGYMSGEAYELPETRMELREPALEVIEECIQPLGTFANSDQDIFRMPFITMGTPDGNNQTGFINHEQDEGDLSSTSSGAEDKAEADSILNITGSPMITVGKKTRKKPLTFAIPIEASPLNRNDDDDYHEYDESSDPGMGGDGTPGYRAVPSDTDTSAVDSDPYGHGLEDNVQSGRHKRLGKRKKNFKNHDEAWFMSHDSKGWSRVRFICFWGSITSMVSACILAGVLIFLMPRNCDPNVEWYQGKVIMDIRPSQNGPNGTTILDLDQIKNRLIDYRNMGIATLHLKDLADKNSSMKSGDLLTSAQNALGNSGQIEDFFDRIHKENMTIIVQVPVLSLSKSKRLDLELEHYVDDAIKFWISHGADGIFLDGLEIFDVNVWVAQKISYWHGLLDRYSSKGLEPSHPRILMTSYKFAKELTDNVDDKKAVEEALEKIDLLDAHLDLDLKTNITHLEEDMGEITHWDTLAHRPWINWNLQTQTTNPASNAAVAVQMLLPGTINLNLQFDESDSKSQPNQDFNPEALKNMTTLRALAIPIYMNGNYKRCDCDEENTKEINYALRQPMAETIQLERYYNRRNRYVLVANFGEEHVNLEPVGQIYSGGELVLDTSNTLNFIDQEENLSNQVVKFSSIDLQPNEAIVIKLPK